MQGPQRFHHFPSKESGVLRGHQGMQIRNYLVIW